MANAEDGEYLLLDQFQGTGIKLNKITTSYEMDQIAKKLAGQNYVEEMKTTDQNGKVAFQNLETGVYLIKAMKSETYDTISPVLVAIPTWNEADKIMEYDVTVFPKHSAEGTKTVKTGDSVEWRKYLILLLISGLGIGYFGVKRKNL